MVHRCRLLFVSLAAGLVLLGAAAACGGGSSESGRGVGVSCDAMGDLDSFRYAIAVRLDLPGLHSLSGATPAPAFGAFATTLAALLSDFRIEGAYVAPDRRQATLAFQGDEVELREIGEKRWERLGESWGELEPGAPDIQDLTPQVVCEELVRRLGPSLDGDKAEAVDLNGAPARRYTLSETDLRELGNLLGLAAGADLPDSFQVQVWFSAEDEWPLKLDVRSQTTDPKGQTGSVEFSMELRDINNASITIEPPVLSASGG
jgi:hypothetical protein